MKHFLVLSPRGDEDPLAGYVRHLWTAVVWGFPVAVGVCLAVFLSTRGEDPVLGLLAFAVMLLGAAGVIWARNRTV